MRAGLDFFFESPFSRFKRPAEKTRGNGKKSAHEQNQDAAGILVKWSFTALEHAVISIPKCHGEQHSDEEDDEVKMKRGSPPFGCARRFCSHVHASERLFEQTKQLVQKVSIDA